MDTRLIVAKAVFFIHTTQTDKRGGFTSRQPWAGALMHQCLNTGPTPLPVKATLGFKG